MIKRKIVWDKEAVRELKEIYLYIKKESPAGAKKVKEEIFETINKLSSKPEMFPPDSFRDDNSGSYRAFFIYSYRIAYKITDDKILILRIRHTSREPKNY